VLDNFNRHQARSKAVWVVEGPNGGKPIGMITGTAVLRALINYVDPETNDKCWTIFSKNRTLIFDGLAAVAFFTGVGFLIAGGNLVIPGALLVFGSILTCFLGLCYYYRHKKPEDDTRRMLLAMMEDQVTRQEDEVMEELKEIGDLESGRAVPNTMSHASELRKQKLITQFHVTREQIDEYARAFQEFDTDHSGDITKEEVRAYLARQGRSTNEAELQSFMRDFDMDGGGTISFDEFVGFHAELARFEREKAALKAFKNKASKEGYELQDGTIQKRTRIPKMKSFAAFDDDEKEE